MFFRYAKLSCAALLMVGIATTADAQSGTRSTTIRSGLPSGSQTRSTMGRSGASMSTVKSMPVGLRGYCPVCVIEMKKWVKGKPEHRVELDGKVYYFPGEEQRKMFLANPTQYTPALGGDCVVCLTEKGERNSGSIQYSALSGGRLFLFPSEAIKQKFASDPAKYLAADLAMDGKCAVCKVEMNQDMPGKPEFATVHDGMTYQFVSDEQRKMFLANPNKYAVPSRNPANAGSQSR